MSEPKTVVTWVVVIESLKENHLDDALNVIGAIQQALEADPPSLLPLLELSAYALFGLAPDEDLLVSDTENDFGNFFRERVGIPCTPDILREVLRHPAGPPDELPAGVGLNGALFLTFGMLAALSRRDPRPAAAVEYAKLALNLRGEVSEA